MKRALTQHGPLGVPKISGLKRELTQHGPLGVRKISETSSFWELYDQIVDAGCGFIHNRESLLDAYVKGSLYTAYVVETDKLYEDRALRYAFGEWFGSSPCWLNLPAFCVVDGNKACIMVWVREDLRRRGIGSLFVEKLAIEHARIQLAGSEPFWRHHGIGEP